MTIINILVLLALLRFWFKLKQGGLFCCPDEVVPFLFFVMNLEPCCAY